MPPPMTVNGWLRYDAFCRLLAPDIKSILEIGMGTGAMGSLLARRFRYVGLEPDEESFRRADQIVAGGELLNVAEEDFSGGAFDAVCAFEVLEHVEDDAEALVRWQRHLRPGGWLYLSVPAGKRLGPRDVRAGHYRRYECDGLEDTLRRAGLRDIEVVGAVLDRQPALGGDRCGGESPATPEIRLVRRANGRERKVDAALADGRPEASRRGAFRAPATALPDARDRPGLARPHAVLSRPSATAPQRRSTTRASFHACEATIPENVRLVCTRYVRASPWRLARPPPVPVLHLELGEVRVLTYEEVEHGEHVWLPSLGRRHREGLDRSRGRRCIWTTRDRRAEATLPA